MNTVKNEIVLGVSIDHDLTWSIHIAYLLGKFLQFGGYYQN